MQTLGVTNRSIRRQEALIYTYRPTQVSKNFSHDRNPEDEDAGELREVWETLGQRDDLIRPRMRFGYTGAEQYTALLSFVRVN